MANMEFLKQSFIQTTSSFNNSTGSGTLSFLFDNNKKTQYSTVGHDGDTTTVITFSFAAATVVSNMALLNHNLQAVRVFYDGVTANTFVPDPTVPIDSVTSTYMSFASQTVNSITLQFGSTVAGNEEFAIGEWIISERQLQFERNPSTKDFTPAVKRTKVIHKMPDGGVKLYNVQDKFKADLKWKFITTSFRDGLRTAYDNADPLIFIPFPTTSAWDGDAFETVWTNDFDFKNSDNAKTQGFEGKIRLEETPSA